MRKHFTDDEIREIYEHEYKRGMSVRDIAQKHKCTYPTVCNSFWRLGLPFLPSWRFRAAIQPEDMPTICEMRRQGKTYNEIAQHYYCDAEALRNAFKRYNVPMIERGTKGEPDNTDRQHSE